MRIQPDSTVTLYGGVDIDMTSGVQIAFSSIANQRAYFASKLVQSTVNCTTVKKTGALRLEVAGSVVKNCNYLSFVNPSFDNKVWYARITDYEYINNECTEISYLIDFWQTFMFDVDFEPCGVTRQYLNETDYDKAVTNPYDPSIYAFQTDEGLPYSKSLEPRTYNYRVYRNINPLEQSYYDGEYVMHANYYDSESSALDEMGDNVEFGIICLAPIDFEDLPEGAESEWNTLLTNIENHGGFHIEPNAPTYLTKTPNTTLTYLNKMWQAFPHPYHILAIPLNVTYEIEPGEYEYMINIALNLLTTWNAVSQIISIYAASKSMIRTFGVRKRNTEDFNWDLVRASYRTSYYRAGEQGNPNYTPHCQKLYLAPYSYMRVETPAGDTKEYKYEDFANAIATPSAFLKFTLFSNINNSLSTILAPNNYKTHIVDLTDTPYTTGDGNDDFTPTETCNMNLLERIEITDHPQIPFNTDGYLTFLSSQCMNAIGSNTIDMQDQLTQRKYQAGTSFIGSAGQAFNPVGAIGNVEVEGHERYRNADGKWVQGQALGFKNVDIPNPGAIINNAANITNGIISAGGGIADVNRTRAAIDEAAYFVGNNRGDKDLVYRRYDDTKPAHANDIYHPGSASTSIYTRWTTGEDFKLTHVRLRDAILEKYDEYFKSYGYNFASTVDIPYALRYVKGQTGNNNLPHWEQVNGKDSTYVKTLDAHVTHNMLPVSVAIEGMLNAGVRFLKGESLTPSNNR